MSFDSPVQTEVGLHGAITDALLVQSGEVANQFFKEPKNARAYGCSLEGCDRRAFALGLCNAHYIRKVAGKSLDTPLRATRNPNAACVECGSPRGGKGGWNRCKNHYRQLRRRLIKQAAVAYMGGKCVRCSGVFPLAALDFHHPNDDKDSAPSDMFSRSSVERIAQEISKCVLLCANCHRIEHSRDEL